MLDMAVGTAKARGMNPPHETMVLVTTKNTPALTMGIIAIVLGVIGLLVSWIPFVGLLAIPVAGIGLFLAVTGLVLAAVKRFRGWAMPVLGGVICGLAIAVAVGSTTTTSAAISSALNASTRAQAMRTANDDQAQADYRSAYLVLEDIEASYSSPQTDGKLPAVQFTIANNGPRALKRVTVSGVFLNEAGESIAVQTWTPIAESIFDAEILEAETTWTTKPDEPLFASEVPDSWEEGNVRLEVTEIEFADEGQ